MELLKKQHNEINQEYYMKFLFADSIKCDKNITTICTPKRNETLVGFNKPQLICLMKTKDRIVFSYPPQLEAQCKEITNLIRVEDDIFDIKNKMSNIIDTKIKHSIKFVFNTENKEINTNRVTQLNKNHYNLYEEFFINAYPSANIDSGWLKEYFCEIADNNNAYGIIVNGKLVSFAGAPTVPFLSDKVQMMGIYTLESYRKKGYAKSVCAASVKEILRQNKTPMWSCSYDNIGSYKLAKHLGFKEYSHMLFI